MEYVTIAVGLLFSYALIKAVLGIRKPKHLPPGPTPLPIIGSLHLLGEHPHQSLAKLAKIHGPVMFVKLGNITTLVISSAAAAKEVLQKQDLAFSSTRHVPDALNAHNHSLNSVVWMPINAQWRTLRKIINSNIFSGNSLDASQHLRTKKVQELVAYCQKASQSKDCVDIGRAAFRTSLNLLSNTILSKDLTDPYEDSGKEFKEVYGNIMIEAGKPNIVDFFPVFKKLDPQGIRRRLTSHIGKALGLFEELINERMGKKTLKQDPDVLDMILKINHENPQDINREHIKSMLLGPLLSLEPGPKILLCFRRRHWCKCISKQDLFVAGTDTTSNTLEWAMAELLRNPHTMVKVKDELKEVIGKGKIVEEKDLTKLPYLQCIVKETLRIHPPVPFLIPRRVDNQVNINGYTIPKGTQVLVNTWAIGRDLTIWENPLEFKPERFWNSKIDVQGQDFELIPFGAGRRICPGLPLAIRMIPLMLGSLLNNFNMNLDTKIRLDMTERFGITLQKADPLCVFPVSLN